MNHAALSQVLPAGTWDSRVLLDLMNRRVTDQEPVRRSTNVEPDFDGKGRGGGMTRTLRSKSGQPLGKKGVETRAHLMSATRRLLDRISPLNVTAAAITKEAEAAAATFYVYFDDVEDILWAMCDTVTRDTADLFADDMLLRDPTRLEDDALKLVQAYGKIWSRHAPILLFRNLEADRGNVRFNRLLVLTGLPILQALMDRILAACPSDKMLSRAEANAEAVVILAAMDRLAAAVNLYPQESLMPELLERAQARIIAATLRRA